GAGLGCPDEGPRRRLRRRGYTVDDVTPVTRCASGRLSTSLRTPSRPWGARLGSWSCRMCRLLGVVCREPIALDRAIAGEIEPFTAQSEAHGAGWGVAWFEQQRPHIRRHLDVARESAAYREAIAAARGPHPGDGGCAGAAVQT